jgi:zinc transport system substrate-binding protein
MRRRATVAVLLAVLLVASCGGEETAGGGDRLQVVAAFYPVAFAATRVGGRSVEVRNLTPAGTEPHDLELSPDDVDEITDADVVLYLGRGFQPSVEKVAKANHGVDLLRGMALRGADPHIWLDPRLMADAVDEVAAALTRAEPARASAFRAGAGRYRRELDALDREFAQGLATCRRHELVTAHAAFAYLARRYGLTELALAGLSPEAEPDPRRLAALADTVKAKGVTTIFYEDLVSPAVARTLARETGATTAVLSPLEGLTEPQVGAGKTYLTVMRDNLAALRKALACA